MTHLRPYLFLAAALLASAGCDLFQTREPEPPSQGTSSFQTPTDHAIVLQNFRSAIRESNTENYMKCFTDTTQRSYAFDPSAEEQIKFVQWDLEAERRSFQNMASALAAGTAMSLADSTTNTNIASGTAVYTLRYTLTVPHTEANAPRIVRGTMELSMAEDARLRTWSIYRWVDQRSGVDSTWSYLKAWFNR